MDRRNFIKLTAVTGGAATLASCGNPEHQLIRFVPDEDLTPGIAEIKNERLPGRAAPAAARPSASCRATWTPCAAARPAS